MPRRTTKTSGHGQTNTTAQAANHCRAVVTADGTRIRKKIKQDYEKAARDLDHSRRVLDQFQQTDQPQFARWLNSHFGAMLTELREINFKLAAEDAIVFLVENEVLFGGGSYARAYKRVMESQNEPEPPLDWPLGNDQPNGKRDSSAADTEPGTFNGADPMAELLDEFLGQFKPGKNARSQAGFPGGQPAEISPSSAASSRLKELYRAVVRRLHPDSQREMTAQKTEWWHQAQMAYEVGDVEQLEVILTLCEIGESGTTAHTSASRLQRLTTQLKQSLREIKRQIAQYRREPAWNFSGRTDQAAMADQVRRELTGELSLMRQRWLGTLEMIANWKAAAEKLKPSRSRKSSPPNPNFWF